MKKLLLLVFSMLLLSSGLVSAWNYDSSYDYGQAHAYTNVVGSYPVCDGTAHGNYCVGNYYVDVSYTGDKFYMGYSYTSWSPVSNENGYTGIPSASPGRKTLPVSSGHPKGYIICGWDRNEASNGDWAWTSICGGYLITAFNELTIVECYQDSDCGNNQYCKKTDSTTDQDWSCETKVCDEGGERCFGSNLQKCENNQWVDKGIILNKCNVACLEDSDCPEDEVSDKFCSGNNIMETRTDNSCFTDFQCFSSTQDVILETCSFKCEDIAEEDAICIDKICDEGEMMCSEEGNALMCQSNQWELKEECNYGCEDGWCKSFYKTNTFYGIIAGSIAVLIIIIILIIVFTSKKRRK